MKKRKICILLIIIVAVLLIGACIFFLITKGTVEEKDGLLQNSRVYITDAYYEDGEVTYTMVNGTYEKISVISYWPDVQKKKGDTWETIRFHNGGFEIRSEIDPFSTETHWFWLEYELSAEELIGEYRLVDHGNNSTYIVGYFTITEDMLD